jgi:hypothetical protein
MLTKKLLTNKTLLPTNLEHFYHILEHWPHSDCAPPPGWAQVTLQENIT